MPKQKKKKKQKKVKKENATKIIVMKGEETEKEEDLDEEDEESGIYLEKEDVLLLYNALKHYKPGNEDEEMLYEMLLEQFEEILIVDYKVKLRRSEW